VSKPIRDKDLWREIYAVVAEDAGVPDTDTGPAVTVDKATALDRVGGSLELLQQLAGVFRDDCARLVPEIREAIRAGDAAGLCQAAHTLKGMVSFFGASAATEASRRLEELGQAGSVTDAENVFTTLAQEIARVQETLASVCQHEEAAATR